MRAAVLALALLAACAAPPAPPASPPPPDLALAGTRWVMTIEGAHAGTPLPTLEFGDQDRAGGFAGCNQWFAQVDTANGGLTFGAAGMTRRACPEPAMGIERNFAAVLEATRSGRRDDDDLVLLDAHGRQLARFTPAN